MGLSVSFRVPKIHDRVTGGSLVNRRLIAHLKRSDRGEVTVVRAGSSTDSSLRGRGEKREGDGRRPERGSSLRSRDVDVEVVDSLCLRSGRNARGDDPNESSDQSASHVDRVGSRVLIAHYLHCVDPHRDTTVEAQEELELLDGFDGVVAPSRFVGERLVARGVPPEKVFAWEPGLDERFRGTFVRSVPTGSVEPRRRTPLILTVASVVPGKGYERIPELAESLSDLPWTWQLVGETTLAPEFADSVRSALSGRSWTDRIDWLGPISPQAVRARYEAAHVFVLPTQFESLSLATREAMACGCPPVAFGVGGLRDVVEDGRTGLLAPDGRMDVLAEQIRRLLTDESLRREVGRAGRARSRTFPDWDRAGARFVEILAAVAG